MTSEDRKLVLKDLSMRFPYEPICRINEDGYEYNAKLNSRLLDRVENDYFEIKPYLFPLNVMSVKQQMELEKTYIYDSFIGTPIFTLSSYDWMNKHHFDYRGLIERKLAIDATKTNIYENEKV